MLSSDRGKGVRRAAGWYRRAVVPSCRCAFVPSCLRAVVPSYRRAVVPCRRARCRRAGAAMRCRADGGGDPNDSLRGLEHTPCPPLPAARLLALPLLSRPCERVRACVRACVWARVYSTGAVVRTLLRLFAGTHCAFASASSALTEKRPLYTYPCVYLCTYLDRYMCARVGRACCTCTGVRSCRCTSMYTHACMCTRVCRQTRTFTCMHRRVHRAHLLGRALARLLRLL